MPPPNINELGLVLFGTARAWRTRLDQRLRPLGLSQGKWRTLMHLSQGGNKLTQKEIAERMGIEGATLAGLLDRLQNDGWVKRRGSAEDRRCKTVHLGAARCADFGANAVVCRPAHPAPYIDIAEVGCSSHPEPTGTAGVNPDSR